VRDAIQPQLREKLPEADVAPRVRVRGATKVRSQLGTPLLSPLARACGMWREAMKGEPGRPTKDEPKTDNNVTDLGRVTGNSRSYTLSRLKRERPELFAQVADGKLSANAAVAKEPPKTVARPCQRSWSATEEMRAMWAKRSDRWIAVRTGVDHVTVGTGRNELVKFTSSQPGDSSAADLFDGGDAVDVCVCRQGAVPFFRVALLDSPRWPGGSHVVAPLANLLGTQAPIAQPGGSPVDLDLPGPSMATSEATRSSGLTDHRHGPSGLNDTPATRIGRMQAFQDRPGRAHGVFGDSEHHPGIGCVYWTTTQ
jgi:hypothetical protein